MSEVTVYGFEKARIKTHLIAFRLDDIHYAKLLKLFERLKVQPRKDNITTRMTILIDRLGELLVEHEHLIQERHSYAGKVSQSEAQKKELLKQVNALVSKALEHEPGPKEERPKLDVEPTPKPEKPAIKKLPPSQPTKSEQPTPIQVTTKPPVAKEDAKTLLVKHGLIESRTPKCAKGHEYLSPKECDPCAYNRYCNYSSANTHFISHDAA